LDDIELNEMISKTKEIREKERKKERKIRMNE